MNVLRDRGEGRKLDVEMEGNRVVEIIYETVLGLTWNSDLSWKKNTEEMMSKFNQKFYGCSRG